SRTTTQEEASQWINPLLEPRVLDLASILHPPQQRDYFHLPTLDLSRSRVHSNSNPDTPSPAHSYKLPSLDFSQAQASAYWPGAASSTPATTVQSPHHTLPTPPSDTNDRHKPTGVNPSDLAALAASQQPGMASSLEPTATPGSLSARRPAANNLGSMSLPPLPFRQNTAQKTFGSFAFEATQPPQTSTLNSGNLLTPPSNISSNSLSPISNIVNGVNATAAGQCVPSFGQSTPNWLQQPTGTTPYGMGTGMTPQPWPNNVKGLFSPSIAGSLQRNNSNSPSASDGLPPPPPFDLTQVSPYSNSAPSTLPSASANQQAFAQNSLFQAAQSQSQVQTPISAATMTSPPMSGTQLSYMDRPQSATTTYPYSLSQPASAQASTFSSFNSTTSPTQQSPLSAPLTGTSRFSPPVGPQTTFPPPNPQMAAYGFRPYNSQYPMPVIPGQLPLGNPVMTNINNPGNQMAMVGLHSGMTGSMVPSYHSGHAAQIYVNQNQPPLNDRPFKCDQCPQSFNRNHDLKRHKRIHLAVKPFPCGHCDKSFSRKDALKRHILVKGCGKTPQANENQRDGSPDPSDEDNENEDSYASNGT
ncbi:MAG: hypothetical protein Q9217_000837, partial [Psora testacea]